MKDIRITCAILLVLQFCSAAHVINRSMENKLTAFLFSLFGSILLLWFGALMTLTALVWYKSRAANRRQDIQALVLIGLLSIFTFLFSYGLIH